MSNIVDSIVENIRGSGTSDPKLLRYLDKQSQTSPVYQQIKKKPGRKRKRGPRKKGRELPPVDEKWKGKEGIIINECITAIIDYLQVSDAMYSISHKCVDHADKKACKAMVSIKKDYNSARKKLEKKCKIR